MHAPLSYYARTTDTQWSHKSNKSENLGRFGRQNMLWPYLKIWEREWIFGCAVKTIFLPGVRSPWLEPFWHQLPMPYTKICCITSQKWIHTQGVRKPTLPTKLIHSCTGQKTGKSHLCAKAENWSGKFILYDIACIFKPFHPQKLKSSESLEQLCSLFVWLYKTRKIWYQKLSVSFTVAYGWIWIFVYSCRLSMQFLSQNM